MNLSFFYNVLHPHLKYLLHSKSSETASQPYLITLYLIFDGHVNTHVIVMKIKGSLLRNHFIPYFRIYSLRLQTTLPTANKANISRIIGGIAKFFIAS
jgi:hypothetical protein